MDLSNLLKLQGNSHKKKRVGRGIGSGKGGHTSGRGQKGQKAREGHKFSIGYEGGQTPLYKRLPQIGGFRSPTSKFITAIRLSALNSFEDGAKVTPEALVEAGVAKRISKYGVKLLASGELTKKLTLKGFKYSEQAKKLIEKSGSKIDTK
jgi:large subunit ribosomal protein L15